ncbi:MAG: AEC family transporter [Oscillospiraceae bacterium]|nr:AEC family transporter [Oscillospiraceae bacterium]
MLDVFLLTLNKVGILLIFIAIGYFLRRHHDLPDNAGKVLSLLCTLLFTPCYTINTLYKSFTREVFMEKTLLVCFGLIFTLAAIALAYLLSKPLAKSPMDRKSLIYAFSIPNYGYFGYPVVEGVFGQAILGDMMVFMIPHSIATYSFGYSLFLSDKKVNLKRILLTPMVLSIFIGAGLGLSGIQLPSIVSNALTSAGNCMSPCSMILAGFMLGKFPLKKLLTGWRPYILTVVRLVGIPVIFGIVLFLLKVKGIYLLLPLVVAGLPLGLNLVVYPESLGHEKEAADNAKLCFVSYLLSLIVLPIAFALYNKLAL